MIAALLVCVSVYLAVRVALAEVAQRIKEICAKWKGKATEALETETIRNRRVSDHLSSNIDATSNSSSTSTRNRRKGIINSTPFNPLTDICNKPTKMVRWQDMQFKTATQTDSSNRNGLKNGICKIVTLPNRTSSSDDAAATTTINMLHVPSENSNSGILSRTYHRILYMLMNHANFAYSDVSRKVLESTRVKDAINQAAVEDMTENNLDEDEMEPTFQKHQVRAVEMLHRMRSCISSVLLRIASCVMYKLLCRMLNGLFVNKRQIENLKRFSQRNIPIVYIPLHRSHLDYILVTYVLYMNGMRAPLVAAGDNLFIPFFGMLMKGLGAFFIKRKLDPQKGRKDHVYRSVLQTYMLESLHEGHSLEFFIEGGRSRSGKSCLPKAGLLSVVVDSLIEGITDDVYIVPVSISYEKIVDGNFISEQLGKPKVMESFTSAVKAIWRTLHSNYGNTHIEFTQPFSLKEFLQNTENIPPQKTYQYSTGRRLSCQPIVRAVTRRTSIYGTDIVIEDHRLAIKNLAEQIVYDASNSAAIMTTNLLAFLLLTIHRKGATLQQLTASFSWLCEEVVKRNRVFSFDGESIDAIKHANILFGKQLLTSEVIQMEWSSDLAENNNVKIIFFKPVVQLPHILELQYYANSVLSVFLLESVVANALFSILEERKTDHVNNANNSVPRYQLVNRALMLCDILQYEFIFTAPDTDISAALNKTIDSMLTNDVISLTAPNSMQKLHYPSISNGDVESSEDSADEEIFEFSQRIKVNRGDEQLELQFLSCIISPFIEGYWLAASSLVQLGGRELEESILLQEIWKIADDYLHTGLLHYEESFAAEPLKNAMKLFEQWRVIETKVKGKSNYIHVSNVEGVQSTIERIEMFRKRNNTCATMIPNFKKL